MQADGASTQRILLQLERGLDPVRGADNPELVPLVDKLLHCPSGHLRVVGMALDRARPTKRARSRLRVIQVRGRNEVVDDDPIPSGRVHLLKIASGGGYQGGLLAALGGP